MRNLSLLTVQPTAFDEATCIKYFCASDVDSRIYVISEDNILHIINQDTNEIVDTIPLENDDLLEAGSKVNGCEFIPDLEAVCISTTQGDIVLFDINDSSAEVVGSLDSGILTMKWSPDYELVVFVTGNGSIVEMTKEWDIVTEVAIETIAATNDQPEQAIKQTSAAITWRGDGKVFACLSTSEQSNFAVVRVYDRACVFESRSEPSVHIEAGSNLSWRPNGSVITCTQRLPNKYDVIFLERNALRHGEFTLTSDCKSVSSLQWNAGSDILAILIQTKEEKSAVQIWHMNNYHWYLKQQLNYGTVGDKDEVISILWDTEDAMKLRTLQRNGVVELQRYHWDTNVSESVNNVDNQSVCAVVDGAQLLLSPLRRLVPPPPMSASTLPTTHSVNQVFFHPDSLDIFALLNTQQLVRFPPVHLPEQVKTERKSGGKRFYGVGEPPKFDQVTGKQTESHSVSLLDPSILCELPEHAIPRFFQLCCLKQENDETTFAGLLAASKNPTNRASTSSCDYLVQFVVDFTKQTTRVISVLLLPSKPLRLYHNGDTGNIFISFALNGTISQFCPKSNTLRDYAKFPSACSSLLSVIFGEDLSQIHNSHKKSQQHKNNDKGNQDDDDDEFLDLANLDLHNDNEISKSSSPDRREILLGLTERGRLYIEGEELSRECNSFGAQENFILFTTQSHQLCLIDKRVPYSIDNIREQIHTNATTTTTKSNQTQTGGANDHLRQVERGSRIVSAVVHDTKVVLQMPRGNLEVIHPRAIMLSHCNHLLDQQEYLAAFLQIRRHRIDLNLLFDHNPTRFLADIELFIRQIDSPSFLNLFLSSISNDDVTKTLYQSIIGSQQHKLQESNTKLLPWYINDPSVYTNKGKVNNICTAVRNVLQALPEETKARYVSSILTTLVRSQPPLLADALEIVRGLRQKEFHEQQQKKTVSDSVASSPAEAALEYLLFLVDVNRLYDVALSLYDFDLTIMVASKSQKDPKEYLPFLKSLHQLQPEGYQRFTIDRYLHKYESALRNISAVEQSEEQFKEALEVIEKNQLHPLAIELYQQRKEACQSESDKAFVEARIQYLLDAYAGYLGTLEHHHEAGILYLRAGKLEKALEAFQKTTDWAMIFTVAHRLQYTTEQLVALAASVAASFRNLARFRDSAHIVLAYGSQEAVEASKTVAKTVIDQAVDSYVQGCHWMDAYHLANKYAATSFDAIENVLRPAVENQAELLIETFTSKREQYSKQLARIKTVKTNKILQPHLYQPVLRGPQSAAGDAFSDTSSFASSQSSFSFVSVSEGGTKNRRRKKKRRISGKEGSLYEEEFLLIALKKLIPSHADQEDVHSLLEILLLLDADHLGKQLQTAFSEFVSVVENSLDVLIAPVQIVAANDEDREDQEKTKEQVELKEKLDHLFTATTWKLASYGGNATTS